MNISIVEFFVYAVIAYPTLLTLIFSINSPIPVRSNKMTLVRSMYVIPGLICFLLIAGSGVNFTTEYEDSIVNEFTINGTTGATITNSTVITNETGKFILENPIWILLHWLFAAILLLYLLTQILQMFQEKN